MAGFIPAGSSFYFVNKNPSPAFSIGLKCAVPPGYTLRDVRIYRYDAANAIWIVEKATGFDTVNSYVYVITNDLSMPFTAMIDTTPPKIRVFYSSSMNAAVAKGTPVVDSVEIQDNVANCTWYFRCKQGGDPFQLSDASQFATLTRPVDTTSVLIKGLYTTPDNGASAMFIVNNGRFSDTVFLSQTVIRDTNVLFSLQMMWTPLKVTAVLDSPSAKRLLRFVDTTAANPTYDNRYIRLFRFYPDASLNGSEPENQKWAEYAESRDSIFSLTAGKLMWVKTRERVRFDFGRGVTMSLDNPVTIPLNAHGWTDVALPFQFDMRLGDIVTATRGGSPDADTAIAYYRWIRDAASGKYHSEIIYDSTLSSAGLGGDSLVAILSNSTLDGYTIYSRYNGTIPLRIPPVSSAMSAFITGPAPTAKKTAPAGWALRMVPRTGDGTILSSVYCAYDASGAPAVRPYPLPPTFEHISVGVCEEKSGTMNGHRVLHSLTGGGCSYLLAFRNDRTDTKNAEKISFRLDRIGSFPSTLKTALYNASTGDCTELAGTAEPAVEVVPQATELRWLFAGNAEFIASAMQKLSTGKLALEKIYPNPLRTVVHLRYSIPSARVGRIEFSVFDISGKTIWHSTVKDNLVRGGSRECVWYATTSAGRRVASGVYIVKMAAFDRKNTMIAAMERRLTVLP
jgi:hypothetical protein